MYKFNANVSDPNFEIWKKVDNVIRQHRPANIPQSFGYEGMFAWAPQHFGFSKMYRNARSYIQYEFTEEEWLIFKLKWL